MSRRRVLGNRDEMVTGFRPDFPESQLGCGVTSDLTTFDIAITKTCDQGLPDKSE